MIIEQAFPSNEKSDNGSHHHSHSGMTLRDYFASQALALMMREGVDALAAQMDEPDLDGLFGRTARYSYRMADAMLAARSPQESEQ